MPRSEACEVALRTVREFLDKRADEVDRVIFCLYLAEDVQLYIERMQIMFPCP